MSSNTNEELLKGLVEKCKNESGTLVPLLQAIQDNFGYLPEEALVHISEEMDIPLGRIWGVVTFYSQFYLSPRGRNIIKVCHGTACHIGDAEKISETLYQELRVDEGDTTEDGKFTVERVACLGCCSLAPCVMINEKTHGRLTSRKINRIIKEY